ncbi:bifunctional folylpolyglutamate synthase/dihydrofolate synthase [Pseudochryseolinea flava]|uniref:Dihydrofolate synthase/folylpolyglutamate synthase n=1 Tax=Pseudochryseolinea flava TaxID=2059302 RepID=A0A364XVM1_9BACT|nr:folylpolyglutamate synthase/dihydrofolate synthase family protein [Pseudochryseolinea flava]RAV98000.1 bifunctional folylpolyglutamate synthase/dihydrofolate synthase [Pseudochryseolinea flava]
MFLTYVEAIDFLYHNLPMFQRIGAAALKNDLSNTIRLCDALGNPQHKVKTIHVAGTNGKGSTSHMLASILQSAGYKTGLYTSPHLKEFTERIRVDGQMISKDFVLDFVNRIRPAIDEVQPSFFEITVAMAFDYFVAQQVDIAVIEVGLGGRLDSTNVIMPEISVITNIGWDHKDILGDTLEKIASEKAGIIKPGIPVVVSERQKELQEIFIEKASAVKAPILFASDRYAISLHQSGAQVWMKVFREASVLFDHLVLPLQGYYQQKNLAGVLNAVDILNERGWHIADGQLLDGLKKVITQTGLKGRWQTLSEQPLIVCDTGHNLNGIEEVVRQISRQSYDKLHVVLGMVKDKDITDVLRLLPKDAKYYFCQANIPRAMDARLLSEKAADAGLHGVVVEEVNAAIREAQRHATATDMIFIGGSTFVVAEIEGL